MSTATTTAPQAQDTVLQPGGRVITAADLTKRYQDLTCCLHVEAHLVRELVGGQPATDKGLEDFIEHHLGITDPVEKQIAKARIKGEEISPELIAKLKVPVIGAHQVNPGVGDLVEGMVYGVNAVRRDAYGAWIGDWMVKSCVKQAFSVSELFTIVQRSKGKIAESGEVSASGISALHPRAPYRIYLLQPDGKTPAETYYQKFMGRVNTAQGPTSIIHHSECVGEETRFEFELRYMPGKIEIDHLITAVAVAQHCGLGSARSLERGRWMVDRMVYREPTLTHRKPKKEEEVKIDDKLKNLADQAKEYLDGEEKKELEKDPLVKKGGRYKKAD